MCDIFCWKGASSAVKWSSTFRRQATPIPSQIDVGFSQPASDVGFRQRVDVGTTLTSETAILTSREGGAPFRRYSAFRKLERTRIPDETGEQNLGTVNENVALAPAGPAPNGLGDAREPACDPNEQRLW